MVIETKYDIGQELWTVKGFIRATKSLQSQRYKVMAKKKIEHIRISRSQGGGLVAHYRRDGDCWDYDDRQIDIEGGWAFTTKEGAQAECDRKNAAEMAKEAEGHCK